MKWIKGIKGNENERTSKKEKWKWTHLRLTEELNRNPRKTWEDLNQDLKEEIIKWVNKGK